MDAPGIVLICFDSDDTENKQMGESKKFKYESIVALVSYCLSSMAITLLNKAVLSSGQFGMNFLLLAVQAVSSIALLGLFKSTGSIDFKPLRKPDSIKCMSHVFTKCIDYLI